MGKTITELFIISLISFTIASIMLGGSVPNITGTFVTQSKPNPDNALAFDPHGIPLFTSYPHTITGTYTVTAAGGYLAYLNPGDVLTAPPQGYTVKDGSIVTGIGNETDAGALGALNDFVSLMNIVFGSLNYMVTLLVTGVSQMGSIAAVPILGPLLILFWTASFILFLVSMILPGGSK